MKPNSILLAALLLGASWLPTQAAVLLYENDFESPTGFVDTSGRDVSSQSVNTLYDQPGFVFQQIFTVETLEIQGGVAFGSGYSDPSGIGGSMRSACRARRRTIGFR